LYDYTGIFAREAAHELSQLFGSRLLIDVEQVLDDPARQKRDDLGSLAPIASLVVSLASLAWTIRRDVRSRGEQISKDELQRRLVAELPESAAQGALVEVVAEVAVKVSIEWAPDDEAHRQ
jgi:2-polyprenyl-6-methoxyphenol hydroxylase-like FAD-dependent oxidoreductase